MPEWGKSQSYHRFIDDEGRDADSREHNTWRSTTSRRQLQAAKDKSTERIDGIIALMMAIGRAMVTQEEPQPEYQMFFV